MTLDDPRARQAQYLSRGGAGSARTGRWISALLKIGLPILVALAILWAQI